MTSPVQRAPSPRRHWAWHLVEALAALSLLAPLGLAILTLTGSGHRWIDILAQFTAPALSATVLVTVLIALVRLWRPVLLGLMTTALLALAVWPQWFPPTPTARPEAAEVRMYSANVFYMNTDIERMRASIAEADPDIVVLIELSIDTTGRIDRLLEGYPYRLEATPLDQTRGPARSLIASRYPLTPVATYDDVLNDVAATVQTPLGPVHVMGVHLTRPWPYQFQYGQIIQVQRLTELRRQLNGPLIVAGDFNSVSSARIGRQMRDEAGLIAAPARVGTWPGALPPVFGITIDQVYRSPELTFTHRRLGLPTGSDHRPVVTTFTLAE